jgi:hypothetical protein
VIRLLKPHAGGQRAILKHSARYQVVACGRRFGKTELGKLLIADTVLRQGQDAWYISPTYKNSSVVWRDLRHTFQPAAVRMNGADRTIELVNGATITLWTGNAADIMRGGAPGIVVIDEAAIIPELGYLWEQVVYPALNESKGRAVFLSTPKGHNYFWQVYQRGIDPLQPAWKSWQFPSGSNPVLLAKNPAYAEEARAMLPDRVYRQEILAQFIEDAGGVFRGVMPVSHGEVKTPYEGNFVIGVDLGRSNDFTAISVMDSDTLTQVDADRFTDTRWSLQRGRIAAMAAKWRPYKILVEKNSFGSPNIEALQDEGLPVYPFDTTAQSKPALIEDLSLAIERGNITLLNDPVQIAELQAYELERLASGKFRYNAPDGGHDDTVMALALSLRACGQVMPDPIFIDW